MAVRFSIGLWVALPLSRHTCVPKYPPWPAAMKICIDANTAFPAYSFLVGCVCQVWYTSADVARNELVGLPFGAVLLNV
jgi:hypothetical protein